MNRSTAQPADSGTPELDRPELDAAAHALADPTRRRILRLVRDGERSAGELASQFTHLSRPAVSQHLRVLEQAELVVVRRDGNHRMYRGRPEGLDDMRTFIDEMWTDKLGRLKRAAERAEWPARNQTDRNQTSKPTTKPTTKKARRS